MLTRRLLTGSLLLLATAALAHEFWLQPASFRVAIGTTVPLKLLVGANFTGQPWPRPTRRTLRFMRLGPAGAADTTDLRPALRADSVAPALVCPTPGTHLVVLTSAPSFIELPADQFTAYLRAEDLDKALYLRQQRGQADLPGREAYRRCAKTLVLATAHTSPPVDTTYRRVLGLPLELVPEQNPYHLRPGASLTVRVLRAGRPVRGALVHSWEATPAGAGLAAGPAHFATRTNNNGRVLLKLPGNGPYLIATNQIETASVELINRADWVSTWATLTFGGPAALTSHSQRAFTK